MPWWEWALLAASGVGLLFYSLSSLLAAAFFLRRSGVPSRRPPITLLKPLAGSEDGLEENLRSFFVQDYPEFQIVFGGSADAVDRLRREFPDRDVAVVESEAAGSNPKTSNLAGMVGAAKHEILVVTDSDVRADPRFLDRVATAFEEDRVGAATSLCFIPCVNFPTALHSLVWSLDKLSFLLIARAVGALRFGNGCATAVRRKVLQDGGGFEAYSDRVGDGYWWPNLAARAGKRVALLDGSLALTGAPRDWRGMYRLQVRYVREQRALEPWGHFFSIFTYGWLWALVFCYGSGFTTLSLGALGAALFLRLGPVFAAAWGSPNSRILRWLWLVPFRDVWSAALWALSYAGRTVHWRGREFILRRGGELVPKA
jgi:ceramide glucosyltransferase